MSPADVVVFAALGDVLGDPAETIGFVRQYVRPGGHVVIADVFLRDGGSRLFPGFEHYRSRAETVQALAVWALQRVLLHGARPEQSTQPVVAMRGKKACWTVTRRARWVQWARQNRLASG